MILVADSSALIALSVMDALPLLDQLFGRVVVPPAVYQEVTDNPTLPEAKPLLDYLADKVLPLLNDSDVILIDAYGDQGEIEAMHLYKRLNADRLLIDDARGRKVALVNNIAIIGSIGILLLAKQKGLLDVIKPKLSLLEQSNVYVTASLIEKALVTAKEF